MKAMAVSHNTSGWTSRVRKTGREVVPTFTRHIRNSLGIWWPSDRILLLGNGLTELHIGLGSLCNERKVPKWYRTVRAKAVTLHRPDNTVKFV
jgi:hypothetical protein